MENTIIRLGAVINILAVVQVLSNQQEFINGQGRQQ
jgi:hypothetical protein